MRNALVTCAVLNVYRDHEGLGEREGEGLGKEWGSDPAESH